MKTISDSNAFDTEVTKQPGIVLVDFYTEHCPPCRMMNPILDELGKERNDLKIVKVDAASNYEVATRYRVAAVPTFLLFNDGQVKGQLTGSRSKKDLILWITANR